MRVSTFAPRLGHGVATYATHPCPDGGAPPGGCAAALGRGAVPGGDRAPAGRQPHGGDAVEAAPGDGRAGGTPPPAVVRATVAVERGGLGPAARAAQAGCRRRRVRERAPVATADRLGGRADLRGPVPFPLARLCPTLPGLEPPAAFAAGEGARRGADRGL